MQKYGKEIDERIIHAGEVWRKEGPLNWIMVIHTSNLSDCKDPVMCDGGLPGVGVFFGEQDRKTGIPHFKGVGGFYTFLTWADFVKSMRDDHSFLATTKEEETRLWTWESWKKALNEGKPVGKKCPWCETFAEVEGNIGTCPQCNKRVTEPCECVENGEDPEVCLLCEGRGFSSKIIAVVATEETGEVTNLVHEVYTEAGGLMSRIFYEGGDGINVPNYYLDQLIQKSS